MNIVRNDIDAVNATVTVQVSKADYAEKVEKTLKEYKRKANIPGFRPGMVPVGLLKKMYGKAILAEEVNKVMSDALNNYLKENNVNILGELLPNETDQKPIDFDTQEEFEFVFDMAVAPEFEVALSQKDKVDYYDIKVDDKMIEDQVKNHQGRMGKQVQVEEVAEKDMVKGTVAEVSDSETAITVENAVIMPSYIKDEAQQAAFIGKKVGDVVTFNPSKAYTSEAEIASLLKISKEAAKEITSDFTFTITEISRFEEHALDQELFDLLYGKDTVKSEEEFRTKVSAEIKEILDENSFYRFSDDARVALIKKLDGIAFPEAFLKRWVLATNEKVTAEQVEAEFSQMLDALKWQLIRNKIATANEVKVEMEDIEAYAQKVLKAQYAQYGITNFPDDLLAEYAKESLKKEGTAEKYFEHVLENKVTEIVKSAVKLNTKEVSLDEFNQLGKA
ncbi:trigger factor [Paludibacter jiangxiensis]|uniref:Trigger factor n=1 Tax=Paludibacter jiangxiensis TaxID=681398 RepID=A0A161LVP0_9BACT|nr:trigger factor [Paludibacter jiangxiensis]MDP4203442.1 trigger factor [Bacteroidota bacterium]GAT63349.1 trigger factor [Paludibacter jiangxiensis]